MSTVQQHKDAVRQYFDEVYNNHRDALLHDLFHPEFHDYSGHPGSGIHLAKHIVDFERSVFPDIHFTIENMTAEADDVVVQLTIEGTHQGEFLKIAPTGQHVKFSAAQCMRFKDGKIVQVVWHLYDKLAMLQQFGVLPTHVGGSFAAS